MESLIPALGYRKRYPTEIHADVNPYDPPQSDSKPLPQFAPPNSRKSNLWSLLVPAFVGGLIGSALLAPLTRGPGDPTGHGIAFGLGGLISLFAAIVFRSAWRRSHT